MAASASDAAVIAAQRTRVLRFFSDWNFFGSLGIAQILRVEIDDVNAHAVFHFNLTKVMQIRLPMFVLRQIFGDTF